MTEQPLPCSDKLVFDNKEAAGGAATYAAHQYGTKLKIYRCKACSLWHLASE